VFEKPIEQRIKRPIKQDSRVATPQPKTNVPIEQRLQMPAHKQN
jgi:hypothetical protein